MNRARRLIGLVTFFALMTQVAFAAGTSAGTNITNVATASYVDSAGIVRTTQSNQVITVVQQVFSLSVLPNSLDAAGDPTATLTNVVTYATTAIAAPGEAALLPYSLTNTGNGSDTFALTAANGAGDAFDLTSVAIYRDVDCNGVIDGLDAAITSITLAADESACLIVQAFVPVAGTNNGDIAAINLELTSQGDAGVVDDDNWSRVVSETRANLTLFKAPSTTSPAPGDTVTYTITGSNTGGQAAGEVDDVVVVDGTARDGILIRDILPSGPIFAGNLLVTPPAGVTGTELYSTDGGSTWTTTTPGDLTTVTAIALLLSDEFDADGTNNNVSLIAGAGTYSLTFDVVMPDPAVAGTNFDNFADIRFDKNGDGDAADAGEIGTAGTARVTVATVRSVAVGPNGYPDAGQTPAIESDSYTSGGYTVTITDDAQSIATAYSGNTVTFIQTLRNDGNALDSFSLALSGIPSGWTCTIYDSSGVTEVTGPVAVAAYGEVNVVVSCVIPSTFTEDVAFVDAASITLTATSTSDSGQVDTTIFSVGDVLFGFGVDVGNSDQNTATDPNDTPVSQTTAPGTTVTFPIEIKNTGQNTDSFTLAASLPAGWTDGIFLDANCDGIADGSSPISNTGPVAPGETVCYVVNASPPAGTIAATYDVSISTVSDTVGTATNTITNTVTVQEVQAFAFDPNRLGTVTSPGSVIFTHTVTNNGNATATVSVAAQPPQGSFSYQYSLDGITFTNTLDGIVLAANGGSATVYVRVSVADGVADLTSNTVTVTATAVYASSATVTDSAINQTTVQIGVMQIVKSGKSFDGTFPAPTDCASVSNVYSADGSQTRPDDYLCYTVTAENIGSANLTNFSVRDTVPAFTDFVAASASHSGFPTSTILWSTDGTSWSSTPPGAVSTGATIYVGVDTSGDVTITDADVMQPGALLDVTLVVRVK